MNATQQQKLKTTNLAQLLEREFPPRQILISPWLRAAESVLLWAPTGVGKTMLVDTLALAVAGGGEVAGWKADRPRKVLLVDGEMHVEDLRDRLALLADTVEGIDQDAAGENLIIFSRQDQAPTARFPDLAERERRHPDEMPGQEVIMKKVIETGAELVILDNFSTLAEVDDENDAAAMNPILGFLMKLKQANVACILVHHAGKTGTTYRGSSKLATTFEVIIGLKRPDGHLVTDGAAFELAWEKYRGKPTAATVDAEMRLKDDGGRVGWAKAPSASGEMMAVVAAVRSCTHQTQRAVAQALGMDAPKITRLKAKAIGAGMITRAEWNECLNGPKEDDDPSESDF